MFERLTDYREVRKVAYHDVRTYLKSETYDGSIPVYASNLMRLICATDTSSDSVRLMCQPANMSQQALRKYFAFTVAELLSVDEHTLNVAVMRSKINRHPISTGGDVIKAIDVIKALTHAQGYEFDTDSKEYLDRLCDADSTDICTDYTAVRIQDIAYNFSISHHELMLDCDHDLIKMRVEHIMNARKREFCRRSALHLNRYYQGKEEKEFPEDGY